MTQLARLQRRSVFGTGRRNRNAVAHLKAFERRAEALMHDTAMMKALMSRDVRSAFSDPRYERGTSVNATEVRGSQRWTASRVTASDVTRIEGLPLWVTAAFDTETIARHWPHRVSVFSVAASGTETAPKRQRRSKTAGRAALRAARLRDAAGTIVMGQQD